MKIIQIYEGEVDVNDVPTEEPKLSPNWTDTGFTVDRDLRVLSWMYGKRYRLVEVLDDSAEATA